jgi:predicted Zn-dependent protease
MTTGRHSFLKSLVIAGCVALAVPALPALAVGTEDLPDIGAPWDGVLSQGEEDQIGRMILHRLREADELLQDPELTEYVQAIGHRLSGYAQGGNQRFEFFFVRDGAINAFALPGGYIGVNTGLLLATESESELAGVLAHEIAHVTQRHIARMAQSQGQTALATTAGIIAAILLGAAGGMGDDAVQAAIAIAQGISVQNQIDFTRTHEAEADRIGIGTLYQAGFDPAGMPSFFEKLGRRAGQSQVPEFLMTHPVTTSRIAETRDRARAFGEVRAVDSANYKLMRARLRAVVADTPEEAISDFERIADGDMADAPEDVRYGYAVALTRAGRAAEAIPIMQKLLAAHPDIIAYHTGLAQAYVENKETGPALRTFAHAAELFPRNVPLTTRYSQSLIDSGEAEKAHTLLLDLLNNINYTPEQVHMIALAANAAGHVAEAHYYMAELHLMNGDLPLAVRQLELALKTPGIESVQRARYEARMAEIRQHLPEMRSRRNQEPRPEPNGYAASPSISGL